MGRLATQRIRKSYLQASPFQSTEQPTKRKEGYICYRCGSDEHSIRECKEEKTEGLPFAECHRCGGKGHISSACDKNDKEKAMAVKKEKDESGVLVLASDNELVGGDDDDETIRLKKKQLQSNSNATVTKSKPKVVLFK